MKTVYIAGPMRGYPGLNRQAFRDAAQRLAIAGIDSHLPWDVAQEPRVEIPVHDLLLMDFARIKSADAVATLPGWEHSKGARAEVAFAEAIGKPVVDLGALCQAFEAERGANAKAVMP